MAILKAPPQQPRNVTLQLRISEQLKARLGEYVHFLDCTESYVVSEALKLVFDRDKEFKEWAEKQITNVQRAEAEQTVNKESNNTNSLEAKARPRAIATHILFH